ncbi:ribosomal RNA-processing protein 8 [Chaetomidium leptoderma]|uniref:Ribosomal RNA-processing protein 8 n=1 Tax=Chaetomidium leptoderma TaxID=669021 RepID=A0AAN6VR12_9PEZI|nr:ribosomal RNA-processing protein 8 [Chaetomidium leptoderma]
MFPVKGLSISAEKLKIETNGSTPVAASGPKPAKKRKRPGNSEAVTAANFADLWDKVIEHKGQPKKDSKRQKKQHESPAAAKGSAAQPASDKPERKQMKKDKKEKRDSLVATSEPGEEDGDEWGGIDDDEEETPKEKSDKKKKKPKTEAAAPPPAPPAQPALKLTPLQASMREKLISARFRHLNETLYTRPSAEAFELFQESPEMFTEYHEGFRRQVDVWPENPVDGYIADIKARSKVRFLPRNRDNAPITPSQLPLPNTTKTCTIADLGCGDGKLASALQPFSKKLHLDIRSFDLQTGGSALITRADIANLPLASNSVDVAIFCLALMGTNWIDFVEEAYRILRWRGELWVAEIKSRFTNPEAAKKKVVAHSVGNRKRGAADTTSTSTTTKAGPKKPKAVQAAEEEEANLAELAEQVDGADYSARNNNNINITKQQQQDTDISAFLEALRKRGFLLNRDLGEGAVDMGNKMFVRMHFVKAAPAIKGKCAAPGAEDKVPGERKWTDGKGQVVRAPKKKKFIDGDDGQDAAGGRNEAAVLKPCVYKLR